jgi:hypothetical protein
MSATGPVMSAFPAKYILVVLFIDHGHSHPKNTLSTREKQTLPRKSCTIKTLPRIATSIYLGQGHILGRPTLDTPEAATQRPAPQARR